MRARFRCFCRDDSQRSRRAWRTRSSARHKRRQSPSATSCTIKKIAPHPLGLLRITNAARFKARQGRWRPRPSPVGLEAEMREHLASKLDQMRIAALAQPDGPGGEETRLVDVVGD